MHRKKKKNTLVKLLKDLAVGGVYGLIIGLIIGFVFEMIRLDINEFGFLEFMLLFSLSVLLALPIHVFLHELGHWCMGLLAGLQLQFFSLFGFTWVRKRNHFVLRKNWNPFALGQAFMTPKTSRPRWAYALYLLGGVLFNVLFSWMFIFTALKFENIYANAFLVIIGVLGIIMALMNLWPYDQSDGMHLKRLFQEDYYLPEFEKTCLASEALLDAEDFDDLKEWMTIDSHAPLTSMGNLMATTLSASQAECQNDFKKAARIYQAIYLQREDLSRNSQLAIMREYLFALLLSNPNHKHVYQIKKDEMMQHYWEARTPESYRVRAADAFYMRFDLQEAESLLDTGSRLIDSQIYDFDQKVERQLYEILSERVANENLDDLKLLPKEELIIQDNKELEQIELAVDDLSDTDGGDHDEESI